MKLIDFGLTEDQSAKLVQGVSEAQYQLLLGAGFSMSAKDRDGNFLPSGPGLARQLNRDFSVGLSTPRDENLAVVFNEARHSDSGDKSLARYLQTKFTSTQPQWHALSLAFPWVRIWNLNIDDVFDCLLLQETKYKPNIVSWTEPLSPATLDKGELQVVHLHGRAASITGDTDGLIFTLKEYAKAVRSQGDWHSEFWGAWLQRPFLVVGARLLDEFDMAEVLDRGNVSAAATGFPSVAVVKELDDFDRRRLKRAGLIPVLADAATFFEVLAKEVESFQEKFAEMSRRPISIGDAARFNQQFEVLSKARFSQRRGQDFYGGDEPGWADIIAGLDAERELVNAAIRALLECAANKQPGALLFNGIPGAGRSTALLRVGYEFVQRGFQVFRFRGLERPDVDAITSWLERNPKTLLIFDDAADFAGHIREICARAARARLQCLVVAAERSRRSSILEDDLAEYSLGVFSFNNISRRDAINIVSARRSAARMGVGTGWNDSQAWTYFKRECSGDLFMALGGLEQGRGFYSRLDLEWRQIEGVSKPDQVKVLKAISLVHRFGYALPLKVVYDLTQKNIIDLGILDGLHGELVTLDERGLRYRHRMLAEHVFRHFVDARTRHDVSRDIVISLAPLVSPSTMRQRTYPVLVVRQLMDKDAVLAVSKDIAEARDWYDSVQRDFSWNGRYWEQRALLESDAGLHDRAYSYAKQSISVHRHAFSLNTLGRVRLKASIDPNVGLDEGWEFFKEGAASLAESVAHARGYGDYYEHPFMTFFYYAAEFAQRLPVGDARIIALDQLRSQWERDSRRAARQSPAVMEKVDAARDALLRCLVRS